VIAGENDLVVPLEQQELLHQLLPKSEIEIIRQDDRLSFRPVAAEELEKEFFQKA